MPKFISKTLTHWTGRNKPEHEAFEILKKIINTKKILLTYCPNYPKLSKNQQLRTMMVCFTDIPLELSADHCAEFGKFGIGFSKERMILYGANPVFYTTNEMSEKVESFISLIGRLQSEEKDREWSAINSNGDDGVRYQFDTDQFNSMTELAGFMQNYQYNDSKIDYYQREWRINYETLPQAIGMEPQNIPGQGAIYGSIGEGDKRPIASMLFDLNDIDFIVVPREYSPQAEQLVKGSRAGVKIYENEVNEP